jgi:hypothetical protein
MMSGGQDDETANDEGRQEPDAEGSGQSQGQPQGGYQQGAPRQPAQTGPSVGDIFSRPDTKDEIVSGVALYGMVGVGLFLAAFLVPLVGSITNMSGMLNGGLALGPALAVVLAYQHHDELADVADNLVYATTAVTAFGGTFALGLLGGIGGAIGDSIGSPSVSSLSGASSPQGQMQMLQSVLAGFSPGDYIIAAVLVGIGAAVAAAAAVAVQRTVLADGPSPRQAPQGQQPPQQGQR